MVAILSLSCSFFQYLFYAVMHSFYRFLEYSFKLVLLRSRYCLH